MFPLLEAVPPAFSKPLPVGDGGGGTGGTGAFSKPLPLGDGGGGTGIEILFKGPFEAKLGAGGGGGAVDSVQG